MRSRNQRPYAWQWIFLLISAGLAVLYVLEPQRPLQLGQVAAWARALFGQAPPHLEPRADSMLGAWPLIDYGALEFIGCDLSLNESGLSLVTNWRGVSSTAPQTLAVRFVLPGSLPAVELSQALVTNTALTVLPEGFYVGSTRGEIWLRVLDGAGEPMGVQDTLLAAPASGGWLRVCQ